MYLIHDMLRCLHPQDASQSGATRYLIHRILRDQHPIFSRMPRKVAQTSTLYIVFCGVSTPIFRRMLRKVAQQSALYIVAYGVYTPNLKGASQSGAKTYLTHRILRCLHPNLSRTPCKVAQQSALRCLQPNLVIDAYLTEPCCQPYGLRKLSAKRLEFSVQLLP